MCPWEGLNTLKMPSNVEGAFVHSQCRADLDRALGSVGSHPGMGRPLWVLHTAHCSIWFPSQPLPCLSVWRCHPQVPLLLSEHACDNQTDTISVLRMTQDKSPGGRPTADKEGRFHAAASICQPLSEGTGTLNKWAGDQVKVTKGRHQAFFVLENHNVSRQKNSRTNESASAPLQSLCTFPLQPPAPKVTVILSPASGGDSVI